MKEWSKLYSLLTNRNLGLLSEDEQEKIRQTKVAVCGLGGIGSPIAEMLCRLGVTNFVILDHGTFEPTNLNRQIYCFSDNDGLTKTDETEHYLKKINPEAKIKKYQGIDEGSVEEFLEDVDLVMLGIDSVKPCLVLSRAAREMDIPLVEGWAVVAGNVRVFTRETPTLEEVYEMPTAGRSASSLTSEEEKDLLIHSLTMVQKQIPGLAELYPPSAMQRMEEKNEGTTLGPLVWLTCSLMAIEAMKIILNWGKLALAPHFATYNPIDHTVMK